MKNPIECSISLEVLLKKEISILTDLYACQKRMYECVLVRDWILLQNETAVSETYVQIFLHEEKERIHLIRSALPDVEGSKDFYQVTAFFDQETASRINALFRDMKRLLLLSKTENEVFNTYITNARTIVSGMLETVLPARRNKIYTRRGSLVSSNVESLMVNRSF